MQIFNHSGHGSDFCFSAKFWTSGYDVVQCYVLSPSLSLTEQKQTGNIFSMSLNYRIPEKVRSCAAFKIIIIITINSSSVLFTQ